MPHTFPSRHLARPPARARQIPHSSACLAMFARTALRSTVAPLRFAKTTRIDIRTLSSAASSLPSYDNILVSSPSPGVSLITLNRPKALNGESPSSHTHHLYPRRADRTSEVALLAALNSALFDELNSCLSTLSNDDGVHAVVLTGSSKAFAAGADIKEMKDKEFAEVYKLDFLSHWTQLTKFRKPIVAAVSGYAVSHVGISQSCAACEG